MKMTKGKNKGKNQKIAGLILGFLAFGALSGVIGYYLHTFTTCNTTINMTIDPGFGLSWNGGAINATYNCSACSVGGIMFSHNYFDAINNYFAANKTKMLGDNNITSETGITWVTSGIVDMGYSENASLYSNPSNITRCEGRMIPFTFGCMVVVYSLVNVAVYYNGTTHYGMFTFRAIDTFATDFAAGNLTRTVWNNATQYMWRSVDSITIYDWQKMSTGAYSSLLYMNYNSVNTTMIPVTFMP
jgi:hypothetical protein